MKIEQIYTGCLAQGAYYIESNGEVAIIDPLREVSPYIEKAQKEGAVIRYVFETHFHADFVSGHIDLSQKTGAPIVYGPNAQTHFEAIVAEDGQIFKLGNVSIKVLHTPGHTMESSCYLLIDESGKEKALFSGDTLFIGDVGRPDLAQKSDLTVDDLAGFLFDSLREKVMTLPDDVVVYPAHGAGSACGKNMSKETSDILGNQKMFNYALRADMTKKEFIKEVTTGLAPPPKYFPQNVKMNKEGYESIDTVMDRGSQALSPEEFETIANATFALILDTRNPQDFAQKFIPNSINIGLNGQFAPWVGALIPDLKQEIILVTEDGKAEETIIRLARVGYDHTLGYLKGGIEAWEKAGFETDSIQSVSPGYLHENFSTGDILDVRNVNEYNTEHIEGVRNFPLDFINDNMQELDKDKPYVLHCAGGYRSMVAASILKARGFEVMDVQGGYAAIKKTELFEVSETKAHTGV
ncbi:MBL fold metallo-hydrolase [Emticicia sp. CRIBPO]|uniref:MBL fold metallo-hydrolase n=1 Tax=Emticicia sp. CRIBPO TaxID=2683258 RepID=UPI00141206D0|nr:MBL fold metallo-hydrolase [Emticicia sp. CRIBPO]NBA84194.1 MBL fold metallo-hydrolase [Emticicia sp. CRIBPO]